jgi:hypothetical protein
MTEETDTINRAFLEAVNAVDQHSPVAAARFDRLLNGRRKPIPSSQVWRMSKKHRAALGRSCGGITGHTRATIRFGVGKMRLMLPPIPIGGDPDIEWKKWADRVSSGLGSRIPGNWRTKRGRKKRMKWLWRNFGHF